MYKPNGLANCL